MKRHYSDYNRAITGKEDEDLEDDPESEDDSDEWDDESDDDWWYDEDELDEEIGL